MHAHTRSCGCGGRRRRGWPDNVERVTRTVGAVPPLVRSLIGSLDATLSNGLAGRSGSIIAGDGADPAYGFRGYMAYHHGPALNMGASATLRYGPWTALPETSGDVRYLTPAGAAVMDHLRQIAPGGAR